MRNNGWTVSTDAIEEGDYVCHAHLDPIEMGWRMVYKKEYVKTNEDGNTKWILTICFPDSTLAEVNQWWSTEKWYVRPPELASGLYEDVEVVGG